MVYEYKLENGDVVWSDIILVKRTFWLPFEPAGGYPDSDHNLRGFKDWVDYQNFPEMSLVQETEHIYNLGSEKFWIPLDLPYRDKVCRRTKTSQWKIFKAGELTFQTFAAWKNWAIKSCSAWNLDQLKRRTTGDKRVWIYNGGDDYLFFPESNEPESFTSRVLTCRNPHGRSLTLGKTYQVLGQDDDLLVLVDDDGNTRSFLPERFS
jgi:hypothetical protein